MIWIFILALIFTFVFPPLGIALWIVFVIALIIKIIKGTVKGVVGVSKGAYKVATVGKCPYCKSPMRKDATVCATCHRSMEHTIVDENFASNDNYRESIEISQTEINPQISGNILYGITIANQLDKISNLLKLGVINSEEFFNKKQLILDGIKESFLIDERDTFINDLSQNLSENILTNEEYKYINYIINYKKMLKNLSSTELRSKYMDNENLENDEEILIVAEIKCRGYAVNEMKEEKKLNRLMDIELFNLYQSNNNLIAIKILDKRGISTRDILMINKNTGIPIESIINDYTSNKELLLKKAKEMSIRNKFYEKTKNESKKIIKKLTDYASKIKNILVTKVRPIVTNKKIMSIVILLIFIVTIGIVSVNAFARRAPSDDKIIEDIKDNINVDKNKITDIKVVNINKDNKKLDVEASIELEFNNYTENINLEVKYSFEKNTWEFKSLDEAKTIYVPTKELTDEEIFNSVVEDNANKIKDNNGNIHITKDNIKKVKIIEKDSSKLNEGKELCELIYDDENTDFKQKANFEIEYRFESGKWNIDSCNIISNEIMPKELTDENILNSLINFNIKNGDENIKINKQDLSKVTILKKDTTELSKCKEICQLSFNEDNKDFSRNINIQITYRFQNGKWSIASNEINASVIKPKELIDKDILDSLIGLTIYGDDSNIKISQSNINKFNIIKIDTSKLEQGEILCYLNYKDEKFITITNTNIEVKYVFENKKWTVKDKKITSNIVDVKSAN